MYTSRSNTNAVVRNSDNAIIGPEHTDDWAEYLAWLAEGNTPLPAPVEPVPVPQQVPMWAVRTVLQNDGLFDQAQALVEATSDNALKNIWEYGNYALRSSQAINSLALALALTDEQVDQMFIAANHLEV